MEFIWPSGAKFGIRTNSLLNTSFSQFFFSQHSTTIQYNTNLTQDFITSSFCIRVTTNVSSCQFIHFFSFLFFLFVFAFFFFWQLETFSLNTTLTKITMKLKMDFPHYKNDSLINSPFSLKNSLVQHLNPNSE